MGKKCLVLIVDDIKENRLFLRKIIESIDYNVQEAVNGKEGLEIARLHKPDIIISDILMPVMDGFRFCREVKKDDKLKNIPLIFYTATYTDKKDEDFALKLGADKFIIKPTEPVELIKIIKDIFRDVEKGKIKPKEPALKEDKEVFKLYSERLVNKLEKKMLDLEKEITERKKAEERIGHLNLILRSVRAVNQLITKEKDRNVLIQQACEILTGNRGYHKALIFLFDENNKLDIAVQSGIGSDFQLLTNDLKKGKLCNCIQKALNQPEVILIENPVVECKDCPISDVFEGRSTIFVRLEYKNKVYGLLSTSIEKKHLADEEMLDLFGEVTGDIAFALYRLELEAAHEKAENIQRASYNISSAVNTVDNLHELFIKIREYLGNVIDTTNFYVALYDEKTDMISLPFDFDEKDNYETFPAGKILTALVIKTGKPMLVDKKLLAQLVKEDKVETFGTPAEIWLGVPLKVESKVMGVIAVQSYDNPHLYSEKDIEILSFVSEEIALAIQHKQAEEQIKKELKEKIVLLREVHHRVKNNLQVISGLLMLQKDEVTTKEDALKGFAASQDRIIAMAKAYELLLGSEYMSEVSVGKYIQSLADQLRYNYDVHRKVKISYSLEELTIGIEILDRLGLILNEIITNSIQHAFEGREVGNMHIELIDKKDSYVLKISDDGIGIPEEINIDDPDTLGLSLIEMLTTQLKGTLKLDRKNGTSFTLEIPKERGAWREE